MVLFVAVVVGAIGAAASALTPVGADFDYQGRLTDAGAPVNGNADLRFRLYSSKIADNQVGSELSRPNVTLTDGLFHVQLNFGIDAFDGEKRWLEIDARTPAGAGEYTTLSPRQQIFATPFATKTRGILVDSVNNVGIGTTSPAAQLHIDGTSSGEVGFHVQAPGAATGSVRISSPFGHTGISGNANNGNRRDIYFMDEGLGLFTRNDDQSPFPGNGILINEDGDVGIGTTTPASLLDVDGQSSFRDYTRFYGGAKFFDGGIIVEGPNGFNPVSHSLYILQSSPSNALRSVNDGSGLAAHFGGDVEFRDGDVSFDNGNVSFTNGEFLFDFGELVISTDRIRVKDAGINTQTPVFIHRASEANSDNCDSTGCFCYSTLINHPACNGNPDAILIVTVNGSAGSGDPVLHRVEYDTTAGQWRIRCVFDDYFCDGQKFNVLVINP